MKLRDFGIGERTFIIAEIGSNHNGDFNTAKDLAVLAKESGADAVKFQTYAAEKYIDRSVLPMAHVRGVHKTQQDRFKSLQFTPEQWAELAGFCGELGVIFFSTPADTGSADMLDQYVPVFKIQSGDVTNIPLIRHVVKKGKPVIMSTGMATEAELEEAVQEIPRDRLILLHCVAIYPTPADKASLMSIPYLKDKFGLPVGYSDHTMNSLACLVAVGLGAVAIERHFTDNKNQPIGDHKFSADPHEMKQMVEDIREIEVMRGGFETRLSEPELDMRHAMRRGLSLTRDLSAETVLTEDMVIPLRPAKGLPPSRIDDIVGKKVKRDLKKGEFIQTSDIRQ
jgi:sialic acid synthase SpsE